MTPPLEQVWEFHIKQSSDRSEFFTANCLKTAIAISVKKKGFSISVPDTIFKFYWGTIHLNDEYFVKIVGKSAVIEGEMQIMKAEIATRLVY